MIEGWLPFSEPFMQPNWTEEPEQKQEQKTNLPHFQEPKNDNERLLELQYQYKVNGKQEALTEIYELSCEICGKYISKETNRNRHIKNMDLDERSDKAKDAATYIVEQLLKRPDFQINKSFTGYLFLRVMKELYYQRKVDTIVDFVDLDEFFKEGTEDEAIAPEEDQEQQEDKMNYQIEWISTSDKMPPFHNGSKSVSVDVYVTAVDLKGNAKVIPNCYYDYEDETWIDGWENELEVLMVTAWCENLPAYEG